MRLSVQPWLIERNYGDGLQHTMPSGLVLLYPPSSFNFTKLAMWVSEDREKSARGSGSSHAVRRRLSES